MGDTGSMLLEISNEMAAAMKRYYGKGPESSRAYLDDDLLFVVMRGGLIEAERVLLESGREQAVRDFRLAYEAAIGSILIDRVQAVVGRRVLTYQSQILFDPDVSVEIFVLGDEL